MPTQSVASAIHQCHATCSKPSPSLSIKLDWSNWGKIQYTSFVLTFKQFIIAIGFQTKTCKKNSPKNRGNIVIQRGCHGDDIIIMLNCNDCWCDHVVLLLDIMSNKSTTWSHWQPSQWKVVITWHLSMTWVITRLSQWYLQQSLCSQFSGAREETSWTRDHSVYASSQWETALQCNAVSHWLGSYTEWSLRITEKHIIFHHSDVIRVLRFSNHRQLHCLFTISSPSPPSQVNKPEAEKNSLSLWY